jgi:hypothetical protein
VVTETLGITFSKGSKGQEEAAMSAQTTEPESARPAARAAIPEKYKLGLAPVEPKPTAAEPAESAESKVEPAQGEVAEPQEPETEKSQAWHAIRDHFTELSKEALKGYFNKLGNRASNVTFYRMLGAQWADATRAQVFDMRSDKKVPLEADSVYDKIVKRIVGDYEGSIGMRPDQMGFYTGEQLLAKLKAGDISDIDTPQITKTLAILTRAGIYKLGKWRMSKQLDIAMDCLEAAANLGIHDGVLDASLETVQDFLVRMSAAVEFDVKTKPHMTHADPIYARPGAEANKLLDKLATVDELLVQSYKRS